MLQPRVGERTGGGSCKRAERGISDDDAVSYVKAIEGPCRVLLVRHGTTRMNVENRYRGRWDVPLDAQGYQEAVDAARALSDAGLTAVYAGPLRRTIATAQIIADEAGVPDIRILQGLINLDYGTWHGMTSKEAMVSDPAAFDAYRTAPLQCVCPNGERLVDARDRMLEALELIGTRHQGETVVGVTHAVMIRLVIAHLLDHAGDGWRVPVNRGGIVEFQVENGAMRLVTPIGVGSDQEEAPAEHQGQITRSATA
ncbi:MAG TPA: histidine phosphatase family protein [Candidatus Saccharimonadales bacterium]|nr:histidine phosphatase family protein [Candidatus Saccharimonadales bacterium]